MSSSTKTPTAPEQLDELDGTIIRLERDQQRLLDEQRVEDHRLRELDAEEATAYRAAAKAGEPADVKAVEIERDEIAARTAERQRQRAGAIAAVKDLQKDRVELLRGLHDEFHARAQAEAEAGLELRVAAKDAAAALLRHRPRVAAAVDLGVAGLPPVDTSGAGFDSERGAMVAGHRKSVIDPYRAQFADWLASGDFWRALGDDRSVLTLQRLAPLRPGASTAGVFVLPRPHRVCAAVGHRGHRPTAALRAHLHH